MLVILLILIHIPGNYTNKIDIESKNKPQSTVYV